MSGNKFRFSLEGVRKLRRHETQQAEQGLAEAMKARRRQQQQVNTVRRRLTDLDQSAPFGSDASTDLRALRQQDAFRREVQQHLRAALNKLGECKQKEAAVRSKLQSCRRSEEALDTLREQEHARHDHALRKAEAAFLDEQAVMRYDQKNLLSL